MIQSPVLRQQIESIRPFGSTMHTPRTVKVALLLANVLDQEALATRLSQIRKLEIVATSVDVNNTLSCCQRERPQVLVIDPKCDAHAIENTVELLRHQHIQHLLVLDDRVHAGRLASILPLLQVSYMTRECGLQELQQMILDVAATGQRKFCPYTSQRLQLTSQGWQFANPEDKPSIALLTTRELQVMRLLALGNSVRSCAEKLHVSKSTVDNHKARLMKKLAVHKAVDLTRIAIREGLIDV